MQHLLRTQPVIESRITKENKSYFNSSVKPVVSWPRAKSTVMSRASWS